MSEPHCPYCGTVVAEPDISASVAKKVTQLDGEGKVSIIRIGPFKPSHDACVKWLERRSDWAATTMPVERRSQ